MAETPVKNLKEKTVSGVLWNRESLENACPISNW
jgi:hypothetical protein